MATFNYAMRGIVWALTSAGLILICSGLPSATPLDRIRITFLALDQGESTLVEMPGEHTMLLGAGTSAEGPRVVAWLKSRGIRKLKGVVVQTWKGTHMGGVASVLQALPVDQVLTNPCRTDSADAKELDRIAGMLEKTKHLSYAGAIPGDNHVLGYEPLCQVTVQGPTGSMQRSFRQDPNNSLVLEFRLGKTAFLSLGDSQLKHQEALSKELDVSPWGQVLRVGRSGAADSLLARTLRAMKTRVAVIPVASKSGKQPAPTLLTALRRAGVRVYRTDTEGTITVLADDRRIDVQTGGRRP